MSQPWGNPERGTHPSGPVTQGPALHPASMVGLDIKWPVFLLMSGLMLVFPLALFLSGSIQRNEPPPQPVISGMEMFASLAPACLGTPVPFAKTPRPDEVARSVHPIRLDDPPRTRTSTAVPESFDTVACVTVSGSAESVPCDQQTNASASNVVVSIRDTSSGTEIGNFSTSFPPNCSWLGMDGTGDVPTPDWTAIDGEITALLTK